MIYIDHNQCLHPKKLTHTCLCTSMLHETYRNTTVQLTSEVQYINKPKKVHYRQVKKENEE